MIGDTTSTAITVGHPGCPIAPAPAGEWALTSIQRISFNRK